MTLRSLMIRALPALVGSALLCGCGAGGTNPISAGSLSAPPQNTLAVGGASGAASGATDEAANSTTTMQLSPGDLASLEVSLPPPNPSAPPQADVPAVAPVAAVIPFSTRFVVINGTRFAGDHVLVRFQPAASPADIRSLITEDHLQVLGYLHGIQWYVLGIPPTAGVVDTAESLKADPLVEQAGLDPMMTPTQTVAS
ncbi:MAG: hypothetical protein LC772_03420 [Chloroflexi bacterium]|nr:hypothetical protein [Chloroflexota bacterium]